jgi:hypothetical protein
MTRYSIPTEPNRLHDEPGGGLIQFFTDLHTVGFSRDDMSRLRKVDKETRRRAVEAMLAVIETPNWGAPKVHRLVSYMQIKIKRNRFLSERVDHSCNNCTDDSISVELVNNHGLGFALCHVDYNWQNFAGILIRRNDSDPRSIEIREWQEEPVDEWGPERCVQLCTGVLISLDNRIEANLWPPSQPHDCILCGEGVFVVKLNGNRSTASLHLRGEEWHNVGTDIQVRHDPTGQNTIWVRNRK